MVDEMLEPGIWTIDGSSVSASRAMREPDQRTTVALLDSLRAVIAAPAASVLVGAGCDPHDVHMIGLADGAALGINGSDKLGALADGAMDSAGMRDLPTLIHSTTFVIQK